MRAEKGRGKNTSSEDEVFLENWNTNINKKKSDEAGKAVVFRFAIDDIHTMVKGLDRINYKNPNYLFVIEECEREIEKLMNNTSGIDDNLIIARDALNRRIKEHRQAYNSRSKFSFR